VGKKISLWKREPARHAVRRAGTRVREGEGF